MNIPVLSSTLLLTFLSLIGLIFFIRASVKDRTQKITLITEESEESLFQRLQTYFNQRAYQITSVDSIQKQITLEGCVRPSWFLAIFLTVLAALGLVCLDLVLSLLSASLGHNLLALSLLSPLAGWYYWQKAGRVEQIILSIEPLLEKEPIQQQLTITAHRDELRLLQQSLGLAE